MGLCGCKRTVDLPLKSRTVSSRSLPARHGHRPTIILPELEHLNEAGRMILQRTMAKRGDKGKEMSWLNFMVAKMWPHIHEALKLVVAKDLEPKIKDALPSVFGTVSFKTFSLGERHPEIKEIGVAHGKQNQYDGLELDLKIIWNCNADIVVDVQGIEIGIENVHIDGTLKLQFRPLLPHLPSIGGVQITMMSPPNISWNFRGIFAALQADVVSRVMRQVVSDQISELLVVPNLIFLHWLDSEADVDLEVLQFPHPECVVRLCISEATSYGSALTPGAQRLVEHLHNTKGRSIDEIMKISGLTKEQVTSVVHARPSFTTKWHQPISLPIKDLDKAQLEICLGIRRPNYKVLANLKMPLKLQEIRNCDKWQLDKALPLEVDPKMEGSSLLQENLELSLRITLRSLCISADTFDYSASF